MFTANNIPITEKDLIKLFFKNHLKKQEKHKLVFLTEDRYYLDFNHLVSFATNSDNEEYFTEFMRKIKKTVANLKLKRLNSIDYENKVHPKNIVYLPMTFSKILEYFNNKGKIRLNVEKIQNTLVRI